MRTTMGLGGRGLAGTALAMSLSTSVLVVSACADGAGGGPYRPALAQCAVHPDDCNTGDRGPGGVLVVGLDGPLVRPGSGALAAGLDQGTGVAGLIAPSAFTVLPGGGVRYNRDLLAGEPLLAGYQAVYRIRPRARWNDGMPISAADFRYTWKLRSSQEGYVAVRSVVGSDNGKTVTVTFDPPVADWRRLFGALLPAHVASAGAPADGSAGAPADGPAGVSAEVWAGTPGWSGGPYRVTAFDGGTRLELVANPEWYGRTAPTLEKIIFRGYADRAAAVAALERGEVTVLRTAPDRETVDRVRALPGVAFSVGGGAEQETLELNTATSVLGDPALRHAIFTAVDTRRVIEATVGGTVGETAGGGAAVGGFPGVGPEYAHNLLPGQRGYREVGREIAPDDGTGNIARARLLLAGAGYAVAEGAPLHTATGALVPPLRLRYPAGTPMRAAAAELVRAALDRLGLTVVVDPVADFDGALASGDYELALHAVHAGAPVASAVARWRSGGSANHTRWHNPESDALLDRAAIEPNATRAAALLAEQDALVTGEAVALPLFRWPSLLAVTGGYVNIRDGGPAGTLTANAQEWGVPRRR